MAMASGESVSGGREAIYSSNVQSRNVRRAVGSGSAGGRRASAHHPEVMDPSLWGRLSEHLLSHVFARLPTSQIHSVGQLSKQWAATSKTLSFKQLCAEVHPKTFCILGYHSVTDLFQVATFDLETHKWMYKAMKHLPLSEYRNIGTRTPMQDFLEEEDDRRNNTLYAHDGGLICFASRNDLPILVCNPLTNEWKSLPRIDFLTKLPIMLQMVTDERTGGYQVRVVCRPREVDYDSSDSSPRYSIHGSETAEVYDSTTGLWSTMQSGYIYATDNTDIQLPKVFDCRTRSLLSLCHRKCLHGRLLVDSKLVKNRVMALHVDAHAHRHDKYTISELTSEEPNPGSRPLEIRNQYFSELARNYDSYTTILFATEGSILLVADNEKTGAYHHQLVHLHDISHKTWHELPALNDIFTVDSTANHFMCDLRWDAEP